MIKNVQIVSMVTGEEVLCEVVGWRKDELSGQMVLDIKKPFMVFMEPSKGLMVYPWKICTHQANADDVFSILSSAVIFAHNAPQHLADNYIERTTGISLASDNEKRLILES